jgi:hypothetical protein
MRLASSSGQRIPDFQWLTSSNLRGIFRTGAGKRRILLYSSAASVGALFVVGGVPKWRAAE